MRVVTMTIAAFLLPYLASHAPAIDCCMIWDVVLVSEPWYASYLKC